MTAMTDPAEFVRQTRDQVSMLREIFSSQLFYSFKDGICDQLETACGIIERLQTDFKRAANDSRNNFNRAERL